MVFIKTTFKLYKFYLNVQRKFYNLIEIKNNVIKN